MKRLRSHPRDLTRASKLALCKGSLIFIGAENVVNGNCVKKYETLLCATNFCIIPQLKKRWIDFEQIIRDIFSSAPTILLYVQDSITS